MEEEEEAKEESTAVIKPNNPHLAGGEQDHPLQCFTPNGDGSKGQSLQSL